MNWRNILFLLFLSLSLVKAQDCGVVTVGGQKYDLRSLTKTSGAYSGDETAGGILYTFYWNFCKAVDTSAYGDNCKSVNNAVAVQTVKATPTTCYPIGLTNSPSYNPLTGGKGLNITFINSQYNTCKNGAPRITTFLLTCDEGAATPSNAVISEPPTTVCLYEFKINTKWACASAAPPGGGGGGSKGGMSPGSIFLIVFFVGFAVYFAVGAVVKWRVYSASGVELVPNTLFWVGLPGLIKDGFLFVKNKITGAAGYSSL